MDLQLFEHAKPKRERGGRSRKRELFCPAHPEQRIEGNGKKYFLHVLSPEELKARGTSAADRHAGEGLARFVLQADQHIPQREAHGTG